jgi:hypothetical protein
MHTAEALVSESGSFEVEIAIGKLKRSNSGRRSYIMF